MQNKVNSPYGPPRPSSPLAGDKQETTVVPSGPPGMLPLDTALMTLQHHPGLQVLLSLLPSKQDMKELASKLNMAWRHDLYIVKSDLSALQNKVQSLEVSQASAHQKFSII